MRQDHGRWQGRLGLAYRDGAMMIDSVWRRSPDAEDEGQPLKERQGRSSWMAWLRALARHWSV